MSARCCALAVCLVAFAEFAIAAEPPVSVRHLAVDWVVEHDGTAIQTVRFETAVRNDAVAQREAQRSMSYSEGAERLELIEAYTLKPDGRHVPVRPDGIRTQLAPGVANSPAYSDQKQMVAVMPEVSGGDVIVETWRRTVVQPIVPGEFTGTFFYGRLVPWDNVDISISLPQGKTLHTETHAAPVADAEEAGRHVYRWHHSAAAISEDPAALLPIDRVPRMFASTFADWAAFSREYGALSLPRSLVTPRIQAKADEITQGIDDRREQSKLLYSWVAHHVRWVAIYLGTGNYVPHAADDVLANGYGDCKDQVMLLVALMHAKGIAAEPVLVNLGPSYTLSDVPTYSAFNHVITYLPEWQTYADTTSGGAPFGDLPFPEYGKPVLHITEAGDAPRRIAMPPAENSYERLRTVATLGADGTVQGTSASEARGAFASALRYAQRSAQSQGSESFAASQLRSLDENGKGDVNFSAGDPVGHEQRADANFAMDPHPEWLDGAPLVMPTGMRLLTRVGDLLIGPINWRGLPSAEPTPCYSGIEEEDLSLTLPDPLRPVKLPKDVVAEGSFFRYESHWAFAGRTVTVHRSLVSSLGHSLCDGALRAEAARAIPAIRRDLAASIALEAIE